MRQELRSRSIVEQRTVLNLAQLAAGDEDVRMSGSKIERLINTLIVSALTNITHGVTELTIVQAEAPEEVISMITNETSQSDAAGLPNSASSGSSEKSSQPKGGILSDEERAGLLKLQELIRRQLEG